MAPRDGSMRVRDRFRSFYREHQPDLSAIPSLSHRQFRLSLPDGRFRKLPERISSESDLQKALVKSAPRDVYYSVAKWLSPTEVGAAPPRSQGGKDGKKRLPFGAYSRNLFLGADLVFDIDVPPFSRKNLARAQAITTKLVDYLDDRFHLSPRYIAFSGGKGFHVVCDDPFLPEGIPSPFERERVARSRRKALAEDILAAGIAIDAPITADTRRILRVPGTLNSKTGYLCRLISADEISSPVSSLLRKTPRCSCSPGILERGYDAILRIACTTALGGERSGVSSPPFLSPRFPKEMYASYLTNVVCGVQGRYVPFFRWPRKRLEAIERLVRSVQERYGLGPVYLFDAGTEVTGAALRTLQWRRCEKAVKAARSLDAEQFAKYKRQFMRVGPVRGPRKERVLPAPRLLAVLDGPGGEQEASRPHAEFFSGQGLTLAGHPSLHGSGRCQMTFCVLEN